MFIIEPINVENSTGELKLLYKKIERSLGVVPPHFELFATLDIEALKSFVSYNLSFEKHPNIDAKILPLLRLAIAQKECRRYCVRFNTQILLKEGIDNTILEDVAANFHKLPFDNKQKLLLQKVFYSLYNPDTFSSDDLQELYNSGFNDKDFFDLLSYATNFIAKSKMIDIYLS